MSKTIATVGVFLTEDERRHLTRLCDELELQEESALRCNEGPEATTRAAEQAALRKLMNLPASATGTQPSFVVTKQQAFAQGLDELQRLRTMERRLQEWAEQLEASSYNPFDVAKFIAAELRSRMAGR